MLCKPLPVPLCVWLLLAPLATAAHADTGASSNGAEVVVTATRNERATFDTPQAVNIISQRMLAESNAGTTPDALIGEAGVLIQKSNTGGGSPFIRGLTGKQVLILVDGVRLNNSYYRFGPHQYLNTIDPKDIDRIEVVHGPSSVMYGSDALGGVIQIFTKRGKPTSGPSQTDAEVSLRAASADESGVGHLRFEHTDGAFSLIGGLSVKRFGDLKGGKGVGRQVPTGYSEEDGQLKLQYRLMPGHEIVFLQQLVQQHDVPKTNEVLLGTKAQFNYEPQMRSLSYLAYQATELQSALADDITLKLSYNRQKEGEEIIERATPKVETRELTDVRTLGFTAQVVKRLSPMHLLTYGFETYADRFGTAKRRLDLAAGTETAQSPGTPNGARYRSSGLYLQDEINLQGGVQLIPGLRLAEFKATGEILGKPLKLEDNKLTGSLMGLVPLAKGLNLVGSVAQGFRAPNMEDFFGRVDFVSEIPNPDLRPETSLNREIGLKFLDGQTSASLHYFVSTYENLIARATVSPGVRQRQNLRRARIDGVEASLTHRFSDPWRLRAALGHARGEDLDTHNPLQRIPPLAGSGQLRYTVNQGLWYEVSSVFARKQDRLSPEDRTDPRIPAGGTPGYGVVNLALGWRPMAQHELNLTLENIADRKYKSHGSGVYAPGINLVLGYSVRL